MLPLFRTSLQPIINFIISSFKQSLTPQCLSLSSPTLSLQLLTTFGLFSNQSWLPSLPSLLVTDSLNNDDDDAAAPNGGLPGDDALPQAVPAAALHPAPYAPSLPTAQAPPVAAPPVAAPSGADEPGWPAIPATLPQTVSFCFEVGTWVSSSLLPPGVSQLPSNPGPASMTLGNLWAYFVLVYGVTLPPELFLPTLPDFLQGLLGNGVMVVPYPGQATLKARNLICRTFCSHVASALPGFQASLGYRVPMLVSLEVYYSGVRKFVRFFRVCNQADEHSVIFPVPDGAAHRMGKAATTAAY